MGIAEDILTIESNLNDAIDYGLYYNVLPKAEAKLQQSVIENVYAAYIPHQYKRRGTSEGGLADKSTFIAELDTGSHTLTLKDGATGIGDCYGVELAEIIAEGYPFTRFENDMHPAGGRPFHEAAERELIESGDADNGIADALRTFGFTVI